MCKFEYLGVPGSCKIYNTIKAVPNGMVVCIINTVSKIYLKLSLPIHTKIIVWVQAASFCKKSVLFKSSLYF